MKSLSSVRKSFVINKKKAANKNSKTNVFFYFSVLRIKYTIIEGFHFKATYRKMKKILLLQVFVYNNYKLFMAAVAPNLRIPLQIIFSFLDHL